MEDESRREGSKTTLENVFSAACGPLNLNIPLIEFQVIFLLSSFGTIKHRVLLILHCKSKTLLKGCGDSSFASEKERTSWHFWQHCEIEILLWVIWGFFVLKKIEDQNRFFHYKTTNIIIYEVKDMSSFIFTGKDNQFTNWELNGS